MDWLSRKCPIVMGAVGWIIIAFLAATLWYCWVNYLLENLPDLGPGGMHRGLRHMNPARDAIAVGAAIPLLRLTITAIYRRKKRCV